MSVRPAKTQISLGIRPIWSESSLSARRNLGSLATHWAHSEDSDQTGRMPRLIWVFASRTVTLLVLSCRGSYNVCRKKKWGLFCKQFFVFFFFRIDEFVPKLRSTTHPASLNFEVRFVWLRILIARSSKCFFVCIVFNCTEYGTWLLRERLP